MVRPHSTVILDHSIIRRGSCREVGLLMQEFRQLAEYLLGQPYMGMHIAYCAGVQTDIFILPQQKRWLLIKAVFIWVSFILLCYSFFYSLPASIFRYFLRNVRFAYTSLTPGFITHVSISYNRSFELAGR
jgi:hypothetical protein